MKKELLNLCYLALKAGELYPPKIFGATVLKSFRDSKDAFFAIETDDCFYVVFQGSKTTKSWVRNLKFLKTPIENDDNNNNNNNNSNSNSNINNNNNRRIHSGFYNSWKKMKPMINSLLPYFVDSVLPYFVDSKKPIYCIGHSAGGVMALLSWRFLKKYCVFSNVKCVTFGCPDFGNSQMVDEIESLCNYYDSITQVVNGYDLVPRLLDNKLGYSELITARISLVQPWWHRIVRKIYDHNLENYYSAIEDQFPDKKV